jgi:serine/threonine-protein kinase
VTEPVVSARLATALADRYRIERELGAGGMATVYLAQDLKHDRRVAVKVLRPELAAVIGAERFLAEIRTTANLQHPHILPLFDSGAADSFLFYVMPFIEGESLRDRLEREKQLPVGDAVRIATEVASALDYAHRHGVIHRDIKPENILLHDGRALIADFGIALAASKAGGSRMTETGMSLGTPHYMSPEQAMGEREITARSDVYALAVVTYEMLTGDPPFTGSTAQAIVARVMTEPPRSLVLQRHTIPEQVEAAVLTALEKLPADRFASAAEFAAALKAGGDAGPRRLAPRPAAASQARRAAIAALVVLAGAAGYLLARTLSNDGAALPLAFGKATKVTWEPGMEILPAISPDGRTVAFGSGTILRMGIFVRPVAGGRSIRLTDDTSGVEAHPRWSPDGTRVLYLARGGVFSAPAAGGPARPEVPAGRTGPVITAAWAPDGRRIAYAVGDSIFLREADGTSRPVTTVFEPSTCTWSPDGTMLACTSGNVQSMTVGEIFGNMSPSSIVIVRMADGRVTRATDSLTVNQAPAWSPDGRWLHFVSGRDGPRDIYAQRIGGSGLPTGAPLRLTTGLGVHTFSLSADGRRMAYAALVIKSNIWSLTLAPGRPVPFSDAVRITTGSQVVENVNASRDGRWLFYDSDLGGNADVYRLQVSTGIPERLTTDPSDDFAPQVSPDGREVVFHSWRAGNSRDLFVMPLDGGPVQHVTRTPRQEALATWSPDGNALAYVDFTAAGGIWIVRRTDGAWGEPVRRLDHGFWPGWSPDGRQLVFSTSLSAGSIGIVPVDSGPERIVLDAALGIQSDTPFWMAGGRELIFRARNREGRRSIYVMPAEGGTPRAVAAADDAASGVRGGWAFGGDKVFLGVTEQESDVSVMEVESR